MFGHALAAHHVYQAFVPVAHVAALRVGQTLVTVYYLMLNAVYVKPVGAYQVLDLPHIQQIFGYVLSLFR